MLSKKKIKIMFCMADYERGPGKRDLKIIKYYKNDYVRLNMIKSLLCVTFAYILILLLVAVYNMEYIVKSTFELPYRNIAIWVVGIYAALLAVYSFISIIVYSARYNAARKRVKKYFRYLKYLRKNYQSDESDTTEG